MRWVASQTLLAVVLAAACGSDAGTGGAGTGGASGSAGAGGSVGGSPGDAGPDASEAGPDASEAGPDASEAGSDASGEPGALLGDFELTYYWVTTEEEFSGSKNTNLYDSSCNLLATVTQGFADSLKIEGTGRLSDGRILNYDGSCGCPTSPCYLVADSAHPWGYGVQNRALAPFRSFAVDDGEIPYGTALYVPELDGVSMPGEPPWGAFVHDGCVSADDTGGAIIGKHVDWFVALKIHYQSLDGQLGLSSVTVYEGGTRCP